MSEQLFNSKGFCFLLPSSNSAATGSLLLDQGYAITIQQGADVFIQKTLSADFCISHFGKQLVHITIVAISSLGTPPNGCSSVGQKLDKMYTDYIAKQKISDNQYTIVYDNITYTGSLLVMTKENANIPGIVQYTFQFIGERV